MKKLLLIAAVVFATLAQARTTDQCIQEHFALVKQYPDIPYERDRAIVNIWCTCETAQINRGNTPAQAVELCAHSTNEPINRYLQSKSR